MCEKNHQDNQYKLVTNKMALFKFRSLQNLRRLLDILVNNRLYMAHYNEMNDPMEGAFFADASNWALLQEVWEGKRKQLICCFSTDYRNTLLWSHYADSHQGCCLEVDVTSKLEPYLVNYSQDIPEATRNIEEILTHKSMYWKYEKEVRYFKNEILDNGNKAKPWIHIKIKKVLLGYRMSKTDVKFYISLIHSILGDNVEVRQINREELDTGLGK